MTNVREKVLKLLGRRLPAVPAAELESYVSPFLFSSFSVELEPEILSQAQGIVSGFAELRNNSRYQRHVATKNPAAGFDPGCHSILMSYDFHLDPKDGLRLIEINTNASFLALGDLMYEAWEIPRPFGFDITQLQNDVLDTLKDFSKKDVVPRLTIIDDDPKTQKLYIEFLVYQALFESWGWTSRIADYREITDSDCVQNFVYNRYTDFTLEDPSSTILAKAYREKKFCISPHPFDYVLLADKDRFIDLQDAEFLKSLGLSEVSKNAILGTVLKSKTLTEENSEEIWSEKKKWFFKPKNAFGAKQTYRGSSLTKGLFQQIKSQNFLAQEFAQAPERNFKTPEGNMPFKFDLRVYAYKDKAEFIVARIYQGQVTNLRTPYGGFSPVIFGNDVKNNG